MCVWGRDGRTFLAQLRLLLWKNWTLKKRRWGTTLCELLFPLGGILILILIRSLVKIDDVPTIIPVQDKQAASANMPGFLTSLVCGVIGSETGRYQYESIALAAGPSLQSEGGRDLINIANLMQDGFKVTAELMQYQVPCCAIPGANDTWLPSCWQDPDEVRAFVNGNHTVVQVFDSNEAMDEYIGQTDYGWHDSIRTIALGAVIDREAGSGHHWSYTLRANSSDVPWTGININTLQTNYTKKDFFQYYDNHMLTLQWMIESYILSQAQPERSEPPSLFARTKSSSQGEFDSSVAAPSDGVMADPPLWDVSFAAFPVPAHKQDNFKQYVGQVFGLFLVVAFMWPFSRMVRNMVEEKEKKLAEGMKMMGLSNAAFWLSWVVTYLVSFTIVVILSVIVCGASLFKYSNGGLIFLYFFSFCLSLIALACIVTTFFSRAKTAGTLSPFVLLACYMPYFSVGDPDKDTNVKNLSSLLSPVAFSLGSTNILSWEGVFIGSQWNNSDQLVDNYSLGASIAFMFFDTLLYALIAWYLDKVWPGEYGTHLKWYFIFTPDYWKSCFCCNKRRKPRPEVLEDGGGRFRTGIDTPPVRRTGMAGISVTTASPDRAPISSATHVRTYGSGSFTAASGLIGADSDLSVGDDEMDNMDFGPDYEPVSLELRSRVGVKVRGLHKEFKRDGQEVTAVEGLDLDLYQGQCFVLLGHNGAGKTTTISMLTGLITATSGRAQVYGRDMNTEMNSIRQIMGVCPQHDVLFDDLTVYEHLEFFGKLKGIRLPDLHATVMEAIEEVQLQSKITAKSSELSGGQKRRLSLAIALIGDSKVVFLDEPTSGVDPFSRRAIWDLITKKKTGRTIVLTTHFMDEADQLGDRIGIMHHGRMKCCGTSLFLKSKFGVGYCLTLVKDPARARVDDVTRLVQTHVPSAKVLSAVGTELSYSLPFSASAAFPALLGAIDDELDQLGLIQYGLSVTTMEEVFIKVAEEERPTSQDEKAISSSSSYKSSGGQHDPLLEGDATAHLETSTGESTWFTHFRALLLKRFHIQKRDKRALCCQIIVPLILLSLGLGLLRIPPNYNFPTAVLLTGEGGPYNLPNRIPFNGGLDQAVWANIHPEEGTMERFDDGGFGTGMYDLGNFSQALLDNRTQYEQSRYGAFFGTPLNELQFNETYWELTVLTNISAIHGLPAWAALGHQALLRNLTGDSTASIRADIHPFAWTHRQKSAVESINGIFASIVISLAFTFIPASFAVFIVSEREFKSKHLQLISGVSMTSYWAANFVWDLVSFALPTALGAIIIYLYHNPELVNHFGTLLTCFILYGVSIIPFTYLFTFLFTSHSTAQNVMIMVYILGGIIMTNTAFALYLVPNTRNISKTYLRHFFRLLPSFCLGDAIFYISLLPFLDEGEWDLIVTGFDLLYMFVGSLVYFALTLAVDRLVAIPSFVGLFRKDPPMHPLAVEEAEDEDVRMERERLQASALPPGEDKYSSLTDAIEQLGAQQAVHDLHTGNQAMSVDGPQITDLIRIEGLRKVYPKKTAVRDVYFGIPAGMCFGFLGVNGAGKTTTLKMLTGDVIPSQGRAFIGGYDISNYTTEVRRIMGYCPQFDALHDNLTARETLNFYGTIRGIPQHQMARMVNYLIDRLSLTEYADRPAGTYSGGNKRKLSVAIALIGNPPVVFLDEPSTGMDPVSRRFMWDFISETMAERAVILTTHSMEECEALCSRIGILVNGQLKCLGSSQHLKSRFGRGFQIDISTASNDARAARDFLLEHFPDAEMIEDYGGKLKYKILQGKDAASQAEAKKWRLKDIFALIESNKAAAGIAEYSVGQTTLEQIFIQFARKGEHEEFGGALGGGEGAHEGASVALSLNDDQRDPDLPEPPARVRRSSSFETEEQQRRGVTPSTFGYVPA